MSNLIRSCVICGRVFTTEDQEEWWCSSGCEEKLHQMAAERNEEAHQIRVELASLVVEEDFESEAEKARKGLATPSPSSEESTTSVVVLLRAAVSILKAAQMATDRNTLLVLIGLANEHLERVRVILGGTLVRPDDDPSLDDDSEGAGEDRA